MDLTNQHAIMMSSTGATTSGGWSLRLPYHDVMDKPLPLVALIPPVDKTNKIKVCIKRSNGSLWYALEETIFTYI